MSWIAGITGCKSLNRTEPICVPGGNRGLTEGQLNFPSGIAVDKKGNVYVIDSGNHRLTKFAPTEEELKRGQQAKPETANLSAPINLAVKPGDTENILSWLEIPGAVSYNLYFSTDPNLTIETSTKIEGVTTPYVHSGLTNDTLIFLWPDSRNRR